ncbi:MAG: hypothetical protein K0U98_24805 [Deltaproteobacteria bacterium]|nr:hypothetical protein [Deltaproteobacteria bacterium]
MPKEQEFQFDIQLGSGVVVTAAAVSVFAITRAEPRLLEERVVSESQFLARLSVRDGELYYVTADIRSFHRAGEGSEVTDGPAQLIAVFSSTSRQVALSEPVTVATAFSFARFFRFSKDRGQRDEAVILSDPNEAARIAYGMKNNFVGTDGSLSKVIRRSPNGMETNSYALFNFLSNLVFYCLIKPRIRAELKRLTGTSSLLEALVHLPHHPFVEVDAIYGLIAERPQVFNPSLPGLEPPATPVPDQWTLTIKVNDSGAENFLIAGVGYVAFDKNDRAWLTNNVRQGTPNSSTFCVVLEPDGSPAPFSPLFGGGILGAGFGVAVDRAGETIYQGSFGWGPTEWNPQSGSIAAYSHDGRVLSPSNGYTQGLSRVQGMDIDQEGNLWTCSWGSQLPMPMTSSRFNYKSENSAVVVYRDCDPERPLIHCFDSPYHLTFDVAFDGLGHAYVSNSGFGGDSTLGIDPVPSSVFKFRIEGDELKVVAHWVSKRGYECLRQVTVSPGGEVFAVAVKSNRVIRFDRDLRVRGEMTHNIHGPWGVTFDPEGTMFVANFAREMEFQAPASEKIGPVGVTVIRKGDEATAKLMTLPTGGDEVRLANGLPLYGNPESQEGKEIPYHCYEPLMRLTATRVDRAGNLWACNNWKPSAAIDVVQGDPGGDGMVIFVGVAAPADRP